MSRETKNPSLLFGGGGEPPSHEASDGQGFVPHKAVGAGLEPARDFSRWFSKPVPYHSANPPLCSGRVRPIHPLWHASPLDTSLEVSGE